MGIESFTLFVNQELPKRISTGENPASTPADYLWMTTGVGLGAKAVNPASIAIAGQSAYDLAVSQGFVGTLPQWLESLKGKSAYETAVENGFVGTEVEWNARLDIIINAVSEPEGAVLHIGNTGPEWQQFSVLFHARMTASGFTYDSINDVYFIDQGLLP